MNQRQSMTFWGGLALGFIAIVYIFHEMLLPFVAGMVIAYLLNPMVDRLERHKISRTAGAFIVLTVFFLLVVALGFALVPIFKVQITKLLADMPQYLERVNTFLTRWIQWFEGNITEARITKLQEFATAHAGNIINFIVQSLQGVLSGWAAIANLLSLGLVMPLVAFFMLRDWNNILKLLDDLLPRGQVASIRGHLREINNVLSAFLRGQSLVCLSLGIFYGIGLSLAGLHFGLMLGLMIGILSFIPYVGAAFGMITSLLLSAIQFDSWERIAAVLAIFLAGQVLESAYLSPKFLGTSVGLHPVWILFALMAGGSLFGFIGVLLSVPVAAVVGVTVRVIVSRYRRSSLYRGKA
ncbi:MAG: AI-2E family transporter [Dongiaceae bacterium]